MLHHSGLASDIKVKFEKINLAEARIKASKEGKLIFLDFYADWCKPCVWMDQTTLNHATVAEILNQNYIPVKINIDDLDGFEMKKMFDIKYLPTILVFNSFGQMIDRVEETLSPNKMVDLLTKHNTDSNKTIIKHHLNQSPGIKEPSFESETMKKSAEEYKKYFQQKQSTLLIRIQVGVFEKYQGAEEMVQKLREIVTEPVAVFNEYKDGQPIYKICVGQFESLSDAEKFKSSLWQDHNLPGILYMSQPAVR
jgi:thiol-disulfide isomerase/thioredoxin